MPLTPTLLSTVSRQSQVALRLRPRPRWQGRVLGWRLQELSADRHPGGGWQAALSPPLGSPLLLARGHVVSSGLGTGGTSRPRGPDHSRVCSRLSTLCTPGGNAAGPAQGLRPQAGDSRRGTRLPAASWKAQGFIYNRLKSSSSEGGKY